MIILNIRDYKLEDAKLAVHEAIKKGINYIDTAPFYGEGKSEETLGKILKGIPRSSYYIATKVGRNSINPSRAFDFSHDAIIRSVESSLKRLNLEYVDVIQVKFFFSLFSYNFGPMVNFLSRLTYFSFIFKVHDVEFAPSVEIILDETLIALEKIVKTGKARYIGVTGYPLSKLWEVIEKAKTKIDTVLSYCRLTIMDDSLKEYIPRFKVWSSFFFYLQHIIQII